MWMLLFITSAYTASIPPGVPSLSPCLQKCFEDGSILQAANDLNNFKNIAVNIDMFCQVNSDVLKCGRECPDIPELEARTAYSSYICAEKVEEFRLIKECMEHASDSIDSCMQDCGLPAAALRLDSSPAALVNPTAFFDGIGETCDKHICALKCSMQSYEKTCAGSGDLLKDFARFQVTMGVDRLNQTAQKENETNQHIVMNYLKNLPAQCAYMQDPELFDIAITTHKQEETTEETSTESESKETTSTEPEETEKKPTEVPVQFEGDASVTTSSPEETTVEFEPSNEPEVPVGPPEEGATAEPSKEVEGQPETDEAIIDHDGRAQTSFAKSSTVMPTEEESTTELVTGPENDVELVSTTTPEEGEPVIVVDDNENKTDTNDINAEVKSGAQTFAAVAVLALTAIFVV